MNQASLCLLLLAMPIAGSVNSPHVAAPGVAAPDVPHVALQDLDLSAMTQQWGAPQAGRSVDGHPILLAGQTYGDGVGTHADSEITIALDRMALRFTSWVGVDDEVGRHGSVRFIVRVDGVEAVRSEVLRGGDAPRHLSVDLRGAQTLELAVEGGGDGITADHADWADARIEIAGLETPLIGADGTAPSVAARVRALPPPPDVPLDIVRAVSPLAMIRGPRVLVVTPERPFAYRIPATGAAPLRFSARGLPDGLTLDRWSGLLSGSIPQEGTWDVALEVIGPHGPGERGLRIVARDTGEHGAPRDELDAALASSGWGPDLRDSRLTPNEQIAHVTLGALLAEPLLAGADWEQLDAFTRALLTNDEVLGVDEDLLGIPAHRIEAARAAGAARTEVLARPLHDGRVAVGLFNRTPVAAPVTVRWDALGLQGLQPVRNCWLGRNEGEHDGSFTAEVPRHGAQLFIVGRPSAGP